MCPRRVEVHEGQRLSAVNALLLLAGGVSLSRSQSQALGVPGISNAEVDSAGDYQSK